MLPKNKLNKTRQTKKDRIKEERHLHYTTFIEYVCLFFMI